ncbi:flavin reductase family protein [Frateuria aurantia]
MTSKYFYEPAHGHGLAHDPFNAIIGPRPIGWISTLTADGRRNLAPYSFFNAFNYTPPIIGFASIGWKDTVRHIEASGEFVWNQATRSLAEAMNASSAAVPEEIDEFELAGLVAVPSHRVRAPRVDQSPVNFECRLSQLLRLRNAAGDALDTWLVLGEVVAVHIEERLLVDGRYDTVAAAPILRGGGPAEYFGLAATERFEMYRPGS